MLFTASIISIIIIIEMPVVSCHLGVIKMKRASTMNCYCALCIRYISSFLNHIPRHGTKAYEMNKAEMYM